jgi:hypothetical protein
MPEIGLIAATRGMLGAGIALVLADKLSEGKRKAIGWPLLAIGVISTVPLVAHAIHKMQPSEKLLPS